MRESPEEQAARRELATWGVAYEPAAVCRSFRRQENQREKDSRTSLLIIVLEVHEHRAKHPIGAKPREINR